MNLVAPSTGRTRDWVLDRTGERLPDRTIENVPNRTGEWDLNGGRRDRTDDWVGRQDGAIGRLQDRTTENVPDRTVQWTSDHSFQHDLKIF